ncbi:hypothetical protein C8R45DRAFT_1024984, partial [Mycena sanguinolenta]
MTLRNQERRRFKPQDFVNRSPSRKTAFNHASSARSSPSRTLLKACLKDTSNFKTLPESRPSLDFKASSFRTRLLVQIPRLRVSVLRALPPAVRNVIDSFRMLSSSRTAASPLSYHPQNRLFVYLLSVFLCPPAQFVPRYAHFRCLHIRSNLFCFDPFLPLCTKITIRSFFSRPTESRDLGDIVR